MKIARLAAAAVGVVFAVAACGDGGEALSAGGGGPAAGVTPTGDVVEVLMVSGRGEIFDPGHVTVKRGDVLRFKLEMGVHNASWPAAENPAGVQLPEATPYLQIPGQTYDVLIDMPPGEYTYHCDPHAALGMIGKLTVEG
jgi:plastocyanin